MSRSKKSRKSLEDSVKQAYGDSIDDHNDSIIIDKSKFASRRKNRLCEVTEHDNRKPNLISTESDSPTHETAYWQEKFLALRNVKDEEFIDLEKQLIIAKQKETKLLRQVELLKEKLQEVSTNSSHMDKNASIDNEQAKRLDLLLSFYESMTAMTVKPEENNNFVCTMKNKLQRRTTRFSIRLLKQKEMVFEPRANVDLLPDYLQSQIQCELDMAPVVFNDILQNIYKESDTTPAEA